MFSIGFSELLVILLIAFVVVGPEDLPKVAVWLAKLVKRFRSLLREVREQTGINDLAHELSDAKRDINTSINTLKSDVNISRELEDTAGSVSETLHQTDKAIKEE